MSKKDYKYSQDNTELPLVDRAQGPRARSTRRVQTPVGDISMTRQEMAADCDINAIMKRYEKTGMIDHVNRYQGRYEDVSNVGDYQTALGIVADAQAAFQTLPAAIRDQFENDPATFLAFVEDPANRPAMREMGLLPRDKPATPPPETPPAEPPQA